MRGVGRLSLIPRAIFSSSSFALNVKLCIQIVYVLTKGMYELVQAVSYGSRRRVGQKDPPCVRQKTLTLIDQGAPSMVEPVLLVHAQDPGSG